MEKRYRNKIIIITERYETCQYLLRVDTGHADHCDCHVHINLRGTDFSMISTLKAADDNAMRTEHKAIGCV